MTFVHATSVALKVSRAWHAVLLRGPSGAGKSDLALRLMDDDGARLIADDQTHVARQDRRGGRALVASAPPAIAGKIEVRGIGIVDLPRSYRLASASVTLLVDLVPPEHVERLPEPAYEMLEGVRLPVLALTPFEASASAKLRLALTRIAHA
ncbi:MAG: HPr kinase/phosphatase C-terminal domain-containing protein [Alphaproteobacteria bacterium]|nr:HPr kinase/phosphatase C-terminal domain-containing protein [Alphaproteobacteria bacterium]